MKHWHPHVTDTPLWTVYYQRWTAHLSAAAQLRLAVALTAVPRRAAPTLAERRSPAVRTSVVHAP